MNAKQIGLTGTLLVVMLLAACAPPQPTAVPPTPTPAATTPAATTAPPERVELIELGLRFAAPDGWQRLSPEFLWAPEADSKLRLGLNWVELAPPAELEPAMLPNHSQILASEEMVLDWATGRSFTLELYVPAAAGSEKAAVEAVETHVLFKVLRAGGWAGVDFYISAPTAVELSTLAPALQQVLDGVTLGEPVVPTVMPSLTGTWQTYRDDEYGFSIRYPQDWVVLPLEMRGSALPEDWPIKRGVIICPQEWAEQVRPGAQQDPSTRPVIPPVLVEVFEGDDEQYARAYGEPATSRTLASEPNRVTLEEDSTGDGRIIRYVVEPANQPERRIVVSDQINGFSARVQGNERIASLVEVIAGTVTFK